MGALTYPDSFFPILPWGPVRGWQKPYVMPEQGLQSIAECDFTVAGFVAPEDLPRCEELGLSAIAFGDVGVRQAKEWKALSEREIDVKVRTMVEAAGNSRAILGYYIVDEPGASAFPALARAVQAVEKYAPGKLAYVNLYPDYATLGAPDTSQLETATYAEYLERFVQEVRPQFLSYDNYMVQYSGDMQDSAKAASYYKNLMEVRRVALESCLPFWNIVSSNQIRAHTTIPSPASLAFQAYTTLAAGGLGVSWFTYYGRGYGYAPIDASGKRTLTWRYLREINRQIKMVGPIMNRLRSTGVFFTSPAPVEGLPRLPGRRVRGLEAVVPMMIGEFSGEGSDYAMVVNLNLEGSARFTLDINGPYRTLRVLSAEDGVLSPFDAEKGLWLVAGQGVLIELA